MQIIIDTKAPDGKLKVTVEGAGWFVADVPEGDSSPLGTKAVLFGDDKMDFIFPLLPTPAKKMGTKLLLAPHGGGLVTPTQTEINDVRRNNGS